MRELRARRLTCREVVELLTEYLEDALLARERARVEEHLANCADCVAYLEQMRATIGVLGGLREEDVPTGVLRQLMAAFRDWRRG